MTQSRIVFGGSCVGVTMRTDVVQRADGVLETVVTDEDVRRAYGGDVADETTENPGYSKVVMKMWRRMKKGSCKDNDERSRRIVAELRERRETTTCDRLVAPAGLGQSTLFDFGE